jgi:hypothetical protein
MYVVVRGNIACSSSGLVENHGADILHTSDIRVLYNQDVVSAIPRKVAGQLLRM